MLAHVLSRYAIGGLQGLQAAQRDCSPFLAHFTSYNAMQPIREIVRGGANRPVREATFVANDLNQADTASFGVFQQIAVARSIQARHPRGDENVPECVCLSECNLPSLISHAERYGRFGFVFTKSTIFGIGGRPCTYLSQEYRDLIVQAFQDAARANDPRLDHWRRLVALCHVFRPFGQGGIVQDYTIEREWRLFASIDLNDYVPCAILAPRQYLVNVRAIFPNVDQVISIDDLFEWGA